MAFPLGARGFGMMAESIKKSGSARCMPGAPALV